MPTNKVVRISTDTTPLQELRQQASTLWNDFNQLEGGFKKLAEDTVGVLQKQIDLLEKRNQLMANGKLGSSQGGSELTPIMGGSGVESILQKIYDTETLIYRRLGESFDPSVGGSGPTRGSSGAGTRGSGDSFRNQNGAAGNIDFAGAMNALMSGDLAGSIGKLAGGGMIATGLMIGAKGIENSLQLSLQNYQARTFYDQAINNYGAWYKRLIPGRAAEADKAREALQAYGSNLQSQYLISSLFGFSSSEAFSAQTGGMYRTGDRDGKPWERYLASAVSGAGSGALTGAGVGALFGVIGSAPGAAIGAAIGAAGGVISQAIIEANNTNRDEMHNWASIVLGQNMSEYSQNFYGYRRSGAGIRTSVGDIQQAMVAQKIYNLNEGAIQGAFGATRFGAEGLSASGVMRRFHHSLNGLSSDPTEIAVRLEENLATYARLANALLGNRGSFNQSDITGVITGLQGVGLQGQQLDRFAGALLGQGGDNSDIAQAMKMRAAMAGGANSLSDILAEAEAPTAKTMKNMMKGYEKMYGGNNDLFRIQLARVLGVSIKDVNQLLSRPGVVNKDGSINFDALYRGVSSETAFDEMKAASMVTDYERSEAGISNKKIIEGRNLVGNLDAGVGVDRETMVSALVDKRVQTAITNAVVDGIKRGIN